MRVLLGVGGLILLVVIVNAMAGGDDKKSAAASTTTDASFEVTEGYCATNPADARLIVMVRVRNTGDENGDVQLRPWRRYNDGSENDSFMDSFMVNDVPAHSAQWASVRLNYNALEHDLLECGIYVSPSYDSLNPTPLNVR